MRDMGLDMERKTFLLKELGLTEIILHIKTTDNKIAPRMEEMEKQDNQICILVKILFWQRWWQGQG